MIRQSSPGLGPNQLTSERYSKAAGVCEGGGGLGEKKARQHTPTGSKTALTVPYENRCTQ